MSGSLIVFEGLDGSGKATQAAAVAKRLIEMGEDVRKISFPDYQSQSSALVKMYLAGEIGQLDEVNLYAASNFYSLDRYISYMREWKNDYLFGKTIIADRYTTSNFCHQMSKLPKESWGGYIEWLEHYEYTLLELPRPAAVIYLDMAPQASQKLMTNRYHGNENKKDIHERNQQYLEKCREAALYAAKALGWNIIKCSDSADNPLPIDVITQAAQKKVMAVLNISQNNKSEDLC